MMEDSKRTQIKFGIIFSYGLIAVKLLTGLMYTPIVLHSLGQSQYGIYALTLSVVGYLTVFDSATNAAYVRFFVQMREKNIEQTPRLNAFFFLLYMLLSALAMVGGVLLSINATVVFGNKINPEEYIIIKKSLFILSISLFFEIMNCFWNSVIVANERFAFGKIITLFVAVVSPLFTLPLILNGYSCVSIIVVRLIFSILTFVIESIFCLRQIKIEIEFRRIEMTVVSGIFQFVIFIVLQSIMDQVNWQIDKMILSRTQGSKEISVYSIGSTFNTIYMTIPTAISGVFISRANHLVATKQNTKLMRIFIKTSRICAYVVLIIMINYIFLGEKFVERWAGPEYKNSYIIGLLLMFPLTFSLVLGMGQDITRAKNKHKGQILLDFSVCIINLIISIPLAIKWGALGSAIGTFASELLLCCVIQPLYYYYIVGIDMKKVIIELLPIFKSCSWSCFYGVIINVFSILKVSYLSVAYNAIIITGLYCLVVFNKCFNSEEKSMLYGAVNKLNVLHKRRS